MEFMYSKDGVENVFTDIYSYCITYMQEYHLLRLYGYHGELVAEATFRGYTITTDGARVSLYEEGYS